MPEEDNIEKQKSSKKDKKDIKITDEDIVLFNASQKDNFEKVSYQDRVVFLPHCLRKIKVCKAENTEEGWRCKHCTKECAVNIISREAEKLGYRYFIAPGGSLVFNLMNKYHPKAVLGVACHKELKLAVDMMNSSYQEIAYYTIPLTKDGCVNTEVNVDRVKDALLLAQQIPTISKELVKEQKEYYEKEKAIRKWNFAYLKKYWKYSAVITIAIAVSISILLANLFVFTNVQNTNNPNSNVDVARELVLYEPTVVFSEANGQTIATLNLTIFNQGNAKEKDTLKINVKSFFADNFIEEKTEMLSAELKQNSSWRKTIQIKAHTENSTSFRISLLYKENEIQNWKISSKKTVYITNANYEIIFYGIDKRTNISVDIFNELTQKKKETVNIKIYYYPSWSDPTSDKPMGESEYITNKDVLLLNYTWKLNTEIDIVDLDDKPQFIIKLYYGSKLTDEYSIS